MDILLFFPLEITPRKNLGTSPHFEYSIEYKISRVDLVHLTLWELNQGVAQHVKLLTTP
jgi:hypothetical protein